MLYISEGNLYPIMHDVNGKLLSLKGGVQHKEATKGKGRWLRIGVFNLHLLEPRGDGLALSCDLVDFAMLDRIGVYGDTPYLSI